MSKRTKLRFLAFCLVTAFVLLGAFLISHESLAQEQQRKLTPGEKFEVGGGQSVEIIQCRGEGSNYECEVQFYRGNTPEGKPMWQWAGPLLAGEARVLAQKQTQAGQPRVADNAAQKKDDDDVLDTATEETAEEPATTTDCSFVAPLGDASKDAKPSEQLFKRKIYDRHNMFANGSGTGPLKVGVTFLSFHMSKPFTNTVRIDPARGALRINDAAPVNATIYPVTSKHVVCEQYRNATTRQQIENKYACFKNRDGEWVCGPDGIPKITQLN
jgi:hypothetical protein